jgi:hypothetical protein
MTDTGMITMSMSQALPGERQVPNGQARGSTGPEERYLFVDK